MKSRWKIKCVSIQKKISRTFTIISVYLYPAKYVKTKEASITRNQCLSLKFKKKKKEKSNLKVLTLKYERFNVDGILHLKYFLEFYRIIDYPMI